MSIAIAIIGAVVSLTPVVLEFVGSQQKKVKTDNNGNLEVYTPYHNVTQTAVYIGDDQVGAGKPPVGVPLDKTKIIPLSEAIFDPESGKAKAKDPIKNLTASLGSSGSTILLIGGGLFIAKKLKLF